MKKSNAERDENVFLRQIVGGSNCISTFETQWSLDILQ
jgi:hypothetical protein